MGGAGAVSGRTQLLNDVVLQVMPPRPGVGHGEGSLFEDKSQAEILWGLGRGGGGLSILSGERKPCISRLPRRIWIFNPGRATSDERSGIVTMLLNP